MKTYRCKITDIDKNFLADFDAETAQDYELILPDDDNTSLEFSAFVTDLPLNLDPGAQITCNVTFQITGPVVVASGSGS